MLWELVAQPHCLYELSAKTRKYVRYVYTVYRQAKSIDLIKAEKLSLEASTEDISNA